MFQSSTEPGFRISVQCYGKSVSNQLRPLAFSILCSGRSLQPGVVVHGGLGGAETQIKSLDDAPRVARRAARERFFIRRYRTVALAPVTLLIFIGLKFFGDDPISDLWMDVLYATLAWAIAVAVYTFYLTFWGFSCPVCGWRFGIGEKCSSCGLPRHGDESIGNLAAQD